MPRQKKTPLKQKLEVTTIKLTEEEKAILHLLSQEASDNLGWTITPSTITRALVQYAGRQTPGWAATTLYPRILEEIAAGRVWGYKKE